MAQDMLYLRVLVLWFPRPHQTSSVSLNMNLPLDRNNQQGGQNIILSSSQVIVKANISDNVRNTAGGQASC